MDHGVVGTGGTCAIAQNSRRIELGDRQSSAPNTLSLVSSWLVPAVVAIGIVAISPFHPPFAP